MDKQQDERRLAGVRNLLTLSWIAAGLFFGSGCATSRVSHGVAPSGSDSDSSTRVVTLARTTASWNGSTLPAYPAGQPEITILHITVPPGVALPVHRHPVINAGILLEGELTVETESGDKLLLQAGESIVEVVETWHYGRNDGDTPAVIIVVYAGINDGAITEYVGDEH